MLTLDDLSPKLRNQLLEIEEDYHEFVDVQMSHRDWEHINFPDYAVLYHGFFNRDIADQFWKELADK